MSDPEGRWDLDLGEGVLARWNIEDGEKIGILYNHPADTPTGRCESGITFDLPKVREIWPDYPVDRMWQLESLDPLTVSPSLLCTGCQHHGFIRTGRWVPA